MTGPQQSPELAAIQRLAARLAAEIANNELATARLAAQTAEIAALRADLEALAAAAKKTPATKKPAAKRAKR